MADRKGDWADTLAHEILGAHCACYAEAWPAHTCADEAAEVAAKIRAATPQTPAPTILAKPRDDFSGDNAQLIECIKALLALDAKGALVPHGLGGEGSHAVRLLSAAACRLSASDSRAPEGWQPDDIRAQGWAVAVHNDYRLGGVPHTFWLFTKGDKAIKGEGRTDAEALGQIRTMLAAAPPTPATEGR